MNDLTPLRVDLEKLHSQDRGLGLRPDARVHAYRLEAVVDPGRLSDFERTHQLELPDDYRAFLTQVGNGGVGPGAGVFPFGHRQRTLGMGVESFLEDAETGALLAAPFPHGAAWNEGAPPGVAGVSASERPERYFRRELIAGTIPLAHHGWGVTSILVVRGPERGHVWFDARSSSYGLLPAGAFGAFSWTGGLRPECSNELEEIDGEVYVTSIPRDPAMRWRFLDWYRAWLDAALRVPF